MSLSLNIYTQTKFNLQLKIFYLIIIERVNAVPSSIEISYALRGHGHPILDKKVSYGTGRIIGVNLRTKHICSFVVVFGCSWYKPTSFTIIQNITNDRRVNVICTLIGGK